MKGYIYKESAKNNGNMFWDIRNLTTIMGFLNGIFYGSAHGNPNGKLMSQFYIPDQGGAPQLYIRWFTNPIN